MNEKVICLGISFNPLRGEIFLAEKTPTKETHPQYDMTVSPCVNVDQAILLANMIGIVPVDLTGEGERDE